MRTFCLVTLLIGACLALASRVNAATPQPEFVPEWAKSVVWYQIFPERFRDGDPSNNPHVEDIAGAYPDEPPSSWQIHPWGSDWYELQNYEKQNHDKDSGDHIQRRRYGGDLQGIIDELPYLKKLGITAIYLNPIFDAPSLHKYDAASYHHVDPNFGPDPVGDRALMAHEDPLNPQSWVWTRADELALKLIDEVHAAGMRIIFDGVFNHMGVKSFAFRDLVKNQQASPYRNWFKVNSWNDPAKGTVFDYKGWFGVKTLPELARDDHGLLAGPRDYIFNATRRWMNPKGRGIEHGVDGWRLDVAYCVPHGFWKAWRKEVRSINPNAYLSAELVLPYDDAKPYLKGDEFDGEMNYNFGQACAQFFFHPAPVRLSASAFDKKLQRLREAYPPGVAAVTMNLIDSHDTGRVGSLILNRQLGDFGKWAEYFQLSIPSKNPSYNTRRPGDAEIALQKLFVIFQMTYLGAPMVYYGDEVGMWGGNDPDCRKPMIWADRTYADEVYGVNGTTTHAPDKVSVREDLLAHYQLMIAIRNRHPALLRGEYRTLSTDNARGLFVFERTYGTDRVVVILNNSGESVDYQVKDLSSTRYRDEVSGAIYTPTKRNVSVTVPAHWGAVLAEASP